MPMLVLIVVLGFFPNIIFNVTDPRRDQHASPPSSGPRELIRCSPSSSTFAWEAPSVDFHAFAPEIVVAATLVILLIVDAFTGDDKRWASSSIAGIGLLVALIPVATLAYDGIDRVMFGGGYVVDDYALVLKALFLLVGLRRGAAVDELHRRGRLLGGRVLPADPGVGARHDGHGLGPRPHQHLRRPRAALDPRLHARRLAQARPQEQRGRSEVLPDGRVRLGGHALRHVADLRRHRHARCWSRSRRRSAAWPSRRSRSSPSASCSCSSASPSRSRPCRSTPGRPTPTRARRPRSPRSWPSPRRPPASWPC